LISNAIAFGQTGSYRRHLRWCRALLDAMTSCPSACSVGISLLKHEPSAHSPWTNTMLGLVCADMWATPSLGMTKDSRHDNDSSVSAGLRGRVPGQPACRWQVLRTSAVTPRESDELSESADLSAGTAMLPRLEAILVDTEGFDLGIEGLAGNAEFRRRS